MSAISPCGLECDVNITPDQLLRQLIRQDENGCWGLAVKQVDGSSGDCTTKIDCDNIQLSWKQLVLSIIYFDPDACPAVRVIID